ncbi:MAG: hemerythrin domain-containing protein [Nitrospiraceae bacterium]
MSVPSQPSPGPIADYLGEDHARLDRLLARAVATLPGVDRETYDAFRAGLLRHIGIEEKILIPAIQASRGGEALDLAARLRRDHAAIATLLMPSPTAQILATLREIWATHNRLEEEAKGLYAIGDGIPQSTADAQALLEQCRAAPLPKVMPHSDTETVMTTLHRVLERAGYRLHTAENA